MADKTWTHIHALVADGMGMWNRDECCWWDFDGSKWSVDELNGIVYTRCVSPLPTGGQGKETR